jgi:hypothetical protein
MQLHLANDPALGNNPKEFSFTLFFRNQTPRPQKKSQRPTTRTQPVSINANAGKWLTTPEGSTS